MTYLAETAVADCPPVAVEGPFRVAVRGGVEAEARDPGRPSEEVGGNGCPASKVDWSERGTVEDRPDVADGSRHRAWWA